MEDWLESYKVLGVRVGAGMADVTDSYRKLCRKHHPDVSEAPNAEELMKEINIAYTVLRNKFKRESMFSRERVAHTRSARHSPADAPEQEKHETPKNEQTEAQKKASDELRKQKAAQYVKNDANADKEARVVLQAYFEALNAYDFGKAYTFISEHDKRYISQDSFTEWRAAVAKLYPMREFKISTGSSIAMVTWDENETFQARKFKVIITEDDFADDKSQSGDIDKLVVHQDDGWRVFLGYKSVKDLKKTFDVRFETKKRNDFQKRWKEFNSGMYQEFNMLNLDGMHKAVSKELYRRSRYGGAITFAVLSIELVGGTSIGQEELLRSAAKTINNALREIDIPAYAGDGIFAIMFVELQRDNADATIARLIESIRKNAGSQLGSQAQINYTYEVWVEGNMVDIGNINNILQKFGKKV